MQVKAASNMSRGTMTDFVGWVRHGIKRGGLAANRRAVLGVWALIVSASVVSGLYLALVGHVAAQGRHIQQLQAQLFQLDRENQQIEVDVAREQTVPALRERAAALGLVPAEKVEFVVLQGN